MSVNVCVLRNMSNAILNRWNNQSTTPLMTKKTTNNWYYYLTSTSGYYTDGVTNQGATAYLSLPRNLQRDHDDSTRTGTFLLETGYEALAFKANTSSDVEISVRSGSTIGSALKSIYLSGETAYFHAVNTSKYRFLKWTLGGADVSTSAVYSTAMTADKTLAMVSEQYKWLLATLANDTVVGQTTIVGGSASGYYEDASTVNIAATVKTAYLATHKFKRWTLDDVEVSTSATLQVTTEDADKTYVAVFIPINYTLDVAPQYASNGTVSVAGQITTTGLSIAGLSGVTVNATPAFGYVFLAWYAAGVLKSYSAEYSFSMPEANLALEARFTILATAATTITKTKGLIGAADAKDMGSVSQYHLDTIFDTISAVGTATLVSNLFNTKSYKFVPTPADDTYQFDGWYQTVEGAQVAIVTGGAFTVEGNTLYILPTTADAIAVNAQFSERSYCEITPVASDSSVYSIENPAEDAVCTCVVNTLPPDDDDNDNGLHDAGDRWLSGQTITVEARQASGWELRSWIVKRVSDGVTVASKSKGDSGFGQTFSFNLLSTVQVIAVSAYTLPADQMQIQALLKSGQPLTSGTVEIHPCGDNYIEMENGSTANVDENSLCELTAIPANGYKFLRWRVAAEDGTIVSTVPNYQFTVTASAIYYAEFEATGVESLVLFESGAANKTLNWAGKTYLAPVPVCMSSARVYADAYPVLVSVGMSDNPSHPANVENVITSTAPSQNPFRLPMRRPRKSFVVEITATDTVSEVCIATSMEDLKNA